jgi:hypothetical protein
LILVVSHFENWLSSFYYGEVNISIEYFTTVGLSRLRVLFIWLSFAVVPGRIC